MSRFMSQRFANLEICPPGEHPQNAKYVKLNTSEAPFPPSPEVFAALNTQEVEKLNQYPNPEGRALRQRLAQFYGIGLENVFLANGSEELLNFFFMAFCGEDRPVAFPAVSCGSYPVHASLYRLPYTAVPLEEGFILNPADYCSLGRNIVIANPNSPTGRAISPEDIEKIVKANPDHVVLVDEAYIGFGGESCIPLIGKYKNLLVCQTFSKFRALAGVRLGYAAGDSELIQDLDKIRYSANPYNISRLATSAGPAALDSNAYYEKNGLTIQENRTYTVMQLDKLGFKTLPSQANFIFTRSPRVPGGTLYRALKARGVLVRHWDQPEIADWCRVTIGTKEQMDFFLQKVWEIMKEAE